MAHDSVLCVFCHIVDCSASIQSNAKAGEIFHGTCFFYSLSRTYDVIIYTPPQGGMSIYIFINRYKNTIHALLRTSQSIIAVNWVSKESLTMINDIIMIYSGSWEFIKSKLSRRFVSQAVINAAESGYSRNICVKMLIRPGWQKSVFLRSSIVNFSSMHFFSPKVFPRFMSSQKIAGDEANIFQQIIQAFFVQFTVFKKIEYVFTEIRNIDSEGAL